MNKSDPSVPSRALDPATSEWIDEALALPVGVESALLARVRTRVMDAIRAEQSDAYRTVRAREGDWEAIAPGVERKTLWATPTTRSCMVRMAPGSSVGSHLHPMDEECVVLEGSLCIGDLELKAGDFHVGRGGSTHELTTSATGALVYLRGALESA
jgi:hypothetical protein